MVTAVTTTTRTDTLAPFNGRHLDRCQDGTLWAALIDATAGSMTFAYSQDNGATWTAASGSSFGGGLRPDRGSSLFIDADDYAHVVFSDGSADLSYRRGTPNAGRTAWTWSSPLALQGINPGIIVALPDLIAHRDPAGSGWFAHVVACSLNSAVPAQSTTYDRITISPGGAFTHTGMVFITSNATNDYPNAAGTYPSIDFRHTGDGKTVAGASPDLFVGWRAGQIGSGFGVRFRKAVYSGSTWTWNPEREITNLRGADGAGRWHLCQFDGTRASIAGLFYNGTSDVLAVYDRDAADTTTTITYEQPAGAGSGRYLAGGGAAYDHLANVYLFGGYNANNGLMSYKKYDRAAGTMGAVTQISALAPPSAGASASVKRGYQPGNSIETLFLSGTASPYTIQYDRTVAINNPPTPPTLVAPGNASSVDLAAGYPFDWTPNDPDVADSQTAYAFRRKIAGAAAYEWWNAGTSAWQSTEVFNASTASDLTFPSGKWTNGTIYNWSVATRDNGSPSLTSGYSGDFTVTGSEPPVVTVTAPSGTVTNTSRPITSWSYSDAENTPQETYRVRIFDAATFGAGGFDPATSSPAAGGDSGLQTDTSARAWQVTQDLINGTTYRAYVQVTQAGQQPSVWKWSAFTLSLTPPNTPLLTATDDPAGGRVVLVVTGQDVGPTFTTANTTLTIEYSDDAGQTWAPLRFATALQPDPTTRQAVAYDYEARPGRARTYRAKTRSTA